jgi:hypothetical protein
MLSLKSFHLFFIAISIILTSGLGVRGLFNHHMLLGLISLGISISLVLYEHILLRRLSEFIWSKRSSQQSPSWAQRFTLAIGQSPLTPLL